MPTTLKTKTPYSLARLSTSLIGYCLLAISLAFATLHLFDYQHQKLTEYKSAEQFVEILAQQIAAPLAMKNERALIREAQRLHENTPIDKLCIYNTIGNLYPIFANSLINTADCPINTSTIASPNLSAWHHRPLMINTKSIGDVWIQIQSQTWQNWLMNRTGIIGLFIGLLIIIALWAHYHVKTLIITPLKALGNALETASFDQKLVISPELVARHPLGGFSQILHDTIARANARHSQLKEIAFNDPLTGLPNRRHFWEHLTVSVHRLNRTHKPIAVLLVDLDGFKAVNDRLGHEIGDALLTEVARAMRTCLRQEDFLARLGGDEFTLVLRDCDNLAVPKRIAQKILQALDRTFTLEGEEIRIGASIGIAMAPYDSRDANELTRLADKAMYSAKRRGKSRFAFWGEALNQFSDNLAQDESRILKAIENHALTLHLIPQHSFTEHRNIVGVEVIPMLEPKLLTRSIEEVITQSDSAKLLLHYHSWLFTELSKIINRWKTNPLYAKAFLPLTIQLAPHKLQLTCFVHAYKEALRHKQINPNDIIIQMHEQTLNRLHHLPLNSLEDPLNQHFFSQLQVALTVDDLPDAYTILNKAPNTLVKRLHFSSLRYEVSQLTALRDNYGAENSTIASAQIAATQAVFMFAHRFNCDILISHIDQLSTWNLFKNLGATIGQGSFLSQTEDTHGLEQLLNQAHLSQQEAH